MIVRAFSLMKIDALHYDVDLEFAVIQW